VELIKVNDFSMSMAIKYEIQRNVGAKKSSKSTANTPTHLDFARPEQRVKLEDQAKSRVMKSKVHIRIISKLSLVPWIPGG
jgi:hypothetical protein